MTGPELYEKCVALGLCERAKFQRDRSVGYGKMWTDRPVGWYSGLLRLDDDMATDLCCMTVLRALLKIKVGPLQLVGNESEPYYFACFLDFDMPYDAPGTLHDAQSPSLLESLCLCLLRARGHVESGKE